LRANFFHKKVIFFFSVEGEGGKWYDNGGVAPQEGALSADFTICCPVAKSRLFR